MLEGDESVSLGSGVSEVNPHVPYEFFMRI